MTFLNHPLRRHFAVYAFYLLVAIVITWPLVTVLGSAFAGYAFGDAHEMSRHIWWMKHALQTGQSLFFQPLLGYPNGIEGVILWSDPLQFFPGWLFAFFLPLPAAYNLFVLLTLALNGWAAYFLISKLTSNQSLLAESPRKIFTSLRRSRPVSGSKPWYLRSPFFSPRPEGAGVRATKTPQTALPPRAHAAGLLGGLVFLAAPVMQGHLAGGHGGLLVQWPLPLYAYALFRLRDANGRAFRALALAVLWFVLVPLGHTLQLIYTLLPVTGVFALTLLVGRDWRTLARVVIVGVVGSAILLVFLLPVFSATVNTSAYSAESGVVDFSADLLGIVTPSFNHPLFGQWAYTHAVLGVNIVEGSTYIGLAAALLAAAAVWRRKPARWWLLLAVVAWVLALGPLLKVFNTPLVVTTGDYQTLIPLPWALVENWPLFSLARTPGRFGFALALAIAVLAGYGWDVWSGWIESHQSRVSVGAHGDTKNHSVNQPKGMMVHAPTIALLAFVMAFTLWEYQSFWPLPVRSADIPPAVAALAQRDDIRAVFNLPWDNVLVAKDAIYLQTAHEHPLIAGQVTRKTPVSPAKLALLATLDPALLQVAGADVVIVHRPYDPQNAHYETARTQLGEPFFSDAQLALFNVPPTDEQPGFAALDAAPNTYFYAPESGWVEYRTTLAAADREAVILLDDVPVYRQFITGETPLRLAFPLTPGYHTVTLTTDPPCPAQVIPPMTCPGVTPVSTPETAFIPAEPGESVSFAGGLRLLNVAVLDVTGNQVTVALDWAFDQPRTDQDVRFVHVVDATGTLIAQDDHPLGAQSAGEQRVEVVTITLPDDLPAGAYRVYAGWYTFTGPETIQGFAVLSAVPGAADGQVLIGEFTR